MSTLATKCGIVAGDNLPTVVVKIKAHVQAVMPNESAPYQAYQALMALHGIVATDKIATIGGADAAFIEHYGDGAASAMNRHRKEFA